MVDAISPQALPQENLGKIALDPLNHAIAAGARQALKMGVPAHQTVEMLLNGLASVVAMIEPAGARVALTKDIVAQFAGLVRQHVDARSTTAGGVFIPNGSAVPEQMELL